MFGFVIQILLSNPRFVIWLQKICLVVQEWIELKSLIIQMQNRIQQFWIWIGDSNHFFPDNSNLWFKYFYLTLDLWFESKKYVWWFRMGGHLTTTILFWIRDLSYISFFFKEFGFAIRFFFLWICYHNYRFWLERIKKFAGMGRVRNFESLIIGNPGSNPTIFYSDLWFEYLFSKWFEFVIQIFLSNLDLWFE